MNCEEILHRSAKIDWSFSEGILTSEYMWSKLHSKLILVSNIASTENNFKCERRAN